MKNNRIAIQQQLSLSPETAFMLRWLAKRNGTTMSAIATILINQEYHDKQNRFTAPQQSDIKPA